MRSLTLALTAIAFMALTGCASITTGVKQNIAVSTGSVIGASCSLENNKGSWYVPYTPGIVNVNRSFNDLTVSCYKPGYKRSFTQIASNTKPIVFGNAIFGGLVGAGVDVADGAAYSYPDNINLPLRHA